jgi:phenylacetate-coenzyme A ligase PaaK-like adenylate-forming protein
LEVSTPFAASTEANELYVAAMNEINTWHAAHNDFYGSLWRRHAEAGPLRSPSDAARLPVIHANFFKSHEVLSIPRASVRANFTSSGTTGQKSQMFFDEWSLGCVTRMAAFIMDHFGFIAPETEVDYLLYSYEPTPGMALGTAYTDTFLADFAPARQVTYALRSVGGEHVFDPFGCVRALLAAAEDGIPVRILGFPSFLWFTLERMREMGIPPLELPADSLALLGGGWKGQADKQIDKFELYNRVEEQLGFPEHRVRDMWGAVEHGVGYFECARHNMHAPVYSRVFARDVATLEPIEHGEVGYLNLASPFNTSSPAHSLLMGDLVSTHAGEECGCGIDTDWFVIHGRAGTSKNRSCAVAAAELMGAFGD